MISKINNLHNQAMDFAEEAYLNELKGNKDIAVELNCKAYELEREAAMLLKDNLNDEPSRSVLFRSAASLAFNCEKYEEAERLISYAFIGNPPDEIKEELRDLLEQVNFSRHLSIKGVELDQTEIQMSLASGDAVSLGLVNAGEFIERSDVVTDIIFRTIDRFLGKNFLDRRKDHETIDLFQVFFSVPRAASFAVSIKIAKPITEKENFVTGVFNEFLDCVEIINNDPPELKKRFNDSKYYDHFMQSMKRLAPDGKNIKLVGFTSSKYNNSRKMIMNKTKDEINKLLTPIYDQKITIIKGLLFGADEKLQIIKVKVVHAQEEIIYNVVVKKDIERIVKKYWNKKIELKIKNTKSNKYILKEIIEQFA